MWEMKKIYLIKNIPSQEDITGERTWKPYKD
jgi:hypothetical protein